MNSNTGFLALEKSGVSSRIYLDALTGLRGFAALWVALWHIWLSAGRPVYSWEIGGYILDLTPFIRSGGVGVDIFFVLSGFVLTLPYCQSRLGIRPKVRVGDYFRRRLFRVLPAYYVQLVILIGGLWLMSGSFPLSLLELIAYLAMLHNLIPLDLSLINNVYWTLPIEFEFYLLLPLLSMLLLPRRWIILLLGSVIVVALYRYIGFWGYVADDSIPAKVRLMNQIPGRIDQFVSGMVAAYFYINIQHSGRQDFFAVRYRGLLFLLSLAGFIGLIYLIHYAQPMQAVANPLNTHWGGYWTQFHWHTLSGLVLGLMIFTIALGVRGLNMLLANRLMLYVGIISYSLYLWHYPVLQWIKVWSPPQLLADWPLFNMLLWVSLPILLVSSLSYWWVERPFLRLRHGGGAAQGSKEISLD